MPLGDAISQLVWRDAAAGSADDAARKSAPLRGRFALLPARDDVITPQHVRELEREGI